MDSMQRLSTSLPRNRRDVPNDLLTDFKAAARSVTDLYRMAVTSQKQARYAGYQDALDDLLLFLDKENMGLMDGEGWRVRQWATERLEGAGIVPAPATTDDDEEDRSSVKEEEKDDTRSSSPEIQRRPIPPGATSEITVEDDAPLPRRVVSEPPQETTTTVHSATPHHSLPQTDFTYQSTHAYPSGNHDRDMEIDVGNNPLVQAYTPTSAPSSTETVRLIPRSSRSNRRSNHNRRTGNENRTPLNFNLGSASGTKRKIPFPDFFDISGINDNGDRRDDGGRGGAGKRRHV